MGKRAVIFDLDGTIFDPSKRLHHLDGEKDWKAFHDAMDEDPVIEPIAELARILHKASELGHGIDAVLMVTARHEDPVYVRKTKEALELHDIPYHDLYMRREDDTRPDHIIKTEILQRILDDGYEPVLAIDDRPSIIEMWRDHGITALQCAPDDPGSSEYAGKTLLHMLVGPCSSGKSTYASKRYKPHQIISADELRMQLYGNLNNSPEAQKRIWKLAHGLIKARLDVGELVVLDATNLDERDRAQILKLLPRGVFARYIVIDRDLQEKIDDRGWRTEEMVIKQHKAFRKQERQIMNGDFHPYVTVQDKRT